MATLFAIDRIMFVHSMCSIIRISNEGGRGRDRGECYKELSPLSVDHLWAARKFSREKQLFSQVVRREEQKKKTTKYLCVIVFFPPFIMGHGQLGSFQNVFRFKCLGLAEN